MLDADVGTPVGECKETTPGSEVLLQHVSHGYLDTFLTPESCGLRDVHSDTHYVD